MRRITSLAFTVCLALVLASPQAFSQTQATGAIVGRAQDSSGALIPGVEVTINSPSMIGGARTAVTDEQGSYRFTLLAPGTYRVSFLLQGFKTVNIDGNDVVAGRTLTVTGSLEVATVAEEVTVTSQAPTIDLEAATVGVNWSQKNLDALPYARTLTGLVTMIPGLYATSYDVGGSAFGNGSAPAARSYGRSGGAVVSYDGLIWCQTYGDYGSYEEVNITTASKGAEQMNPGVSMNMIIKSGSNQFHGNFSGLYENGSMQSNNVDQALRDRGYSSGSNKFTHYRNIYGDIGGPVLKDKLWFYFAYTNGYQGALVPGFISLKTGQQAENWIKIIDPTAKLTYQLTSKQKLEAVWQLNRKWAPYRNASSLVPLEATMDQDAWSTLGPQLKWTNILGPRTTATAGIARGGYWWPAYPWSPDVRKTDTTTGATLGGYLKNYTRPIRWQWNFDVSRVTAVAGRSNEIKFGYFGWWDKSYTLNFGYPNQQLYRYTSLSTDTCPDKIVCPNYFQRPNSVQMFDYPNSSSTGGRYKAAYFNDKIVWNRKLTMNVGARVDHFTSFLSRQGNPGEGPWSVKAIFEYTDAFPKYTRWSPRMSFAYDITGTGRLAVKGSFGRYINVSSSPGSQPGPGAGSSGVNPNSSKTCTYNRWDGTVPYVPSLGADGVMGTADDVNLSGACTGGAGSNGIHTFDSNLRSSYLDEYTAGLEVGFSRTYSMRFNVVRKFDHGGSKTVDVLLPSSAYTDVRSAVDRGRDGIAGTADDGIVYAWSVPSTNANRTVVNQQFTNVDLATHEGQNMYTAFETTFNKQFSNKWSYLAAYTVDLAHPSNSNPLNPNSAYYNWQLPTWSQSFKMNGTYDFPWGFKYASTFTAQTGDWYSRTAQVVNALNSTITQTVEGHFGRYDWVKLWDQRVTKSFKFGDRQNLELSWDLFNSMNTNTVTSQTVNSSSSTYLIPSAIISPRIYQWGFKYKF